MFVLLCNIFCVCRKSYWCTQKEQWDDWLLWVMLSSLLHVTFLRHMPRFKVNTFKFKCLLVEGQRNSALSAHLAHLYCLCSVHWGGYKNNKPMVLVHQELAVTLRRCQTVNSLCKVCDCCFDTQYSGRSGKWRAEKWKRQPLELNPLGCVKDSRNRRAGRRGTIA